MGMPRELVDPKDLARINAASQDLQTVASQLVLLRELEAAKKATFEAVRDLISCKYRLGPKDQLVRNEDGTTSIARDPASSAPDLPANLPDSEG